MNKCVFWSQETETHTCSKRVGSGRILTKQLDTTITSHFQSDTVLITDAHNSYKPYSAKNKVEHIVLNGARKNMSRRNLSS
jgi:hypothetical protein